MFSKVFIQFLCLSLALVEIKAYVQRLPENENEITYEKKDPEPNNEEHPEPEQPPHRRHHHHHRKHHNHDEPGHISPYSGDVLLPPPPHGHRPPHHEMLAQLMPLFRSFLSRDIHKTGRVEATNDAKLEAISKTRAFVVNKIKTKYTETLIQNNKLTNDSKMLTKTLETDGETDAVIDFNSDMDVISDKILKAKSDEDSKPVEEKEMPNELPRMVLRHPARNLKRMKRSEETTETPDNSWKNIMGAFKKVGDAIKDGYKKHVEEPVKKFVENVKQKTKEWQEKRQAEADKKKHEQGHDQGDTATEQPQEQHEEK